MASLGQPDLRVRFDHDPAAPAMIRATLNDWFDPSDPAAYDVILSASELVTNVVVHTVDGGEFRLWLDEQSVRIAVSDGDPSPPTVADAVGPQGGFGLRIVSATSRRWGWTPTDTGKEVWAEFALGQSSKPNEAGSTITDHELRR